MTRLWLIVRADGTGRTIRRYPRLRPDEVAFRIDLAVAEGWGKIVSGTIALTIPPAVSR